MHTSGNNEHYEHKLEFTMMHYATVVCTEWFIYIFLICIFNCILCPNAAPRFFCACNALSLNYIGYESDGNDIKAIGGVITFVHLCKM